MHMSQVTEHRGVASLYIDPPYLMDGLKSDLRVYVLITCIHPLRCYVYGEGLARFATEEYDIDDLDKYADGRSSPYMGAPLSRSSPRPPPRTLATAQPVRPFGFGGGGCVALGCSAARTASGALLTHLVCPA